MHSHHRIAVVALAVALTCQASLRAQYEAPPSYYGSITNQTGAALKSQLTTIMSAGHVQTSYAEARDFLPFTDANPDNLTQMFEFYGHAVIQKPSASHTGFVGMYESREHVWPDSLQGPGNTSNSTRGSRGDIHMLKPLRQSTNSSRGNNAFGGAALTGSARNIGSSQWFPSDVDKGDAARIIFYGATRYASTLSVVYGNPTTNTQMGDLNALLRFHYLDVPDLFEQRRNDTIFRGDDIRTAGDDSSFAGTRNRNAYIDRPEYVWSVFVDQQNDTRLSVGAPGADGGSAAHVDFGRVLRNAPTPAPQSVTLNKSGVDGTYYSVTVSGSATSTVNGRNNAFAMDSTGSRTVGIGINASTTIAGMKTGTVTIDNLDVTTAGGVGRGANDADDVITMSLAVLDASNSSFAGTGDLDSLVLDFGEVAEGASASLPFSFFNLSSALGANLTARLDLDSVSSFGNTAALSTNAIPFSNLSAATSQSFDAILNTSLVGDFDATYTFNFSDENLPGTASTSHLTLGLRGSVIPATPTTYRYNIDGDGAYSDASNFTGQIVPTGPTGRVVFGDVISAPRTVTIDLDISLRSLTFDNENAYTLVGEKQIRIIDDQLAPAVNVASGHHFIDAPMVLELPTRIQIDSGASLAIKHILNNDARMVKQGEGELSFSAGQLAELTIDSGRVRLDGDALLKLDALRISADASGMLDVASGAVLLDFAAQELADVQSLIATGAIISSTKAGTGWAVGYVDGVAAGHSYLGHPLDNTTVVIAATLKGDANLDGAVDFDDLLALAQHYDAASTAIAAWFQGDFDYDGLVGFSDLLALAQNYGNPPPVLGSAHQSFAADWLLARSIVPEPSVMMATGLVSGLLSTRRVPRR